MRHYYLYSKEDYLATNYPLRPIFSSRVKEILKKIRSIRLKNGDN